MNTGQRTALALNDPRRYTHLHRNRNCKFLMQSILHDHLDVTIRLLSEFGIEDFPDIFTLYCALNSALLRRATKTRAQELLSIPGWHIESAEVAKLCCMPDPGRCLTTAALLCGHGLCAQHKLRFVRYPGSLSARPGVCPLLEELCDNSDVAGACMLRAQVLDLLDRVPEAAKWWSKAAQLGSAQAQLNLGLRWYNDHHMSGDADTHGLEMLRSAAGPSPEPCRTIRTNCSSHGCDHYRNPYLTLTLTSIRTFLHLLPRLEVWVCTPTPARCNADPCSCTPTPARCNADPCRKHKRSTENDGSGIDLPGIHCLRWHWGLPPE